MGSRFTIYVSILLFFSIFSLLTAQELKVLSSDEQGIVIEYSPSFSVKPSEAGGRVYTEVEFRNSILSSSMSEGQAAIKRRIVNIGVPSENGNIIEVLATEKHTIDGRLLPVPGAREGSLGPVPDYSERTDYNRVPGHEPVMFSEYFISRGLQVQSIALNVVDYNPGSEKITLYDKIVFKVNFGRSSGAYSKINETYLSSLVLNFDVARNWGIQKRSTSRIAKRNSVMATGTWYKFLAPEEGMYKITRDMLSSMGIDAGSVDPRTIKIYNNGGYPLPEEISADRYDGLYENAIIVTGENDGSFDEGDQILFYGRGMDFWDYDYGSDHLTRNRHPFATENWFWITSGGSNGKRMQTLNSVSSSSDLQQNTTLAALSHEKNEVNLIKSGKLFLGEEFTVENQSHTFINPMPDVITDEPSHYSVSFVNAGKYSVSTSFEENGNLIEKISISGGSGLYQIGSQKTISRTYYGDYPDDRSTFKITFKTNSPQTAGYLDYFEIYYKRELTAVEDALVFFSKDTSATITYNLSGFSNSGITVYDITDHGNVSKIGNVNVSAGEASFTINEAEGNVHKYLAVCNSVVKTPSEFEKVENSNLRGITGGADYIVISDRVFKTQVDRYVNYRENESPQKHNIEVAYMDQIYNEFGGGIKDPVAIRDFLKHAYYNWNPTPFYVLFFGDGTFDYFDTEGQGGNYVPTYQSDTSLNEVSSFSMDDFYLRVTNESTSDKERIDFAYGRLTVNDNTEAKNIIDKIIEYENDSEMGVWRNRITFLADDAWTDDLDEGEWKNEGNYHFRDSETLSQEYLPDYYDRHKIYLAQYPLVPSGSGRRKPAANKAIIDAINNGTLLFNFFGHGNPNTWTHEYVFQRASTIPQLHNSEYFFLMAATCDFGRFDDPNRKSGTEEMLLKSRSGSIGTLAAVRSVYANANSKLAQTFFEKLFKTKMNDGMPPDLGTVYFLTKQESAGTNSEKYHMFGDPALRLKIPVENVSIESVNGKPANETVQLKALQKVKISGSKNNATSKIADTDFTGTAIITVYDSEKYLKFDDVKDSMLVSGGVLFRGRVSVTNGEFDSEFTMPKDITYDNKNGKIVAYLVGENEDGVGYTKNVIVGGTDTSAVNDGNPPDVSVYFDDLSYKNSYLVNPDFTLYVTLEDETGLNTSGTGVGHKLEGIVNGNEENTIDFTDHFIGDLDSGGKSGVVKYNFSSFEPGNHSITVKAWDVFNNLEKQDAYFTVVNEDGLVLRDVVNYPNPFPYDTYFTFQHNLNGPVNTKIRIYTVAGRMIREISRDFITDKFVKIYWDGRDEDGDILANGTYLYKLNVSSEDGETDKSVLGKLSVIR